MKYNFDTPINRRGTDSMKWMVGENELPMWVADMDFAIAPEIISKLHERVDHGVFGYSEIPDEWAEAYVNWWERRHHFMMNKEWLIFCTGVVPAISSMVRKLTTPNENVVIQTPVYNIFFNSIINNGCRVLESPLLEENGSFSMDFEDLEKKLSNPQTSLMILCNPQNPVGRIWSKEELAEVGRLCRKYNVVVISDEIHCDITEPGREYVPFASVSEDCREMSVTCIAPTKAFNMAGMQTAAVSVPNPFLRHKVWRGLNTDEVAEPNSFATLVAITAFNEGEEWLEELRQYISNNRKCVEEYVAANFPEIRVVSGEATYLLWLDCRKITDSGEKLAESIREKTGLYLAAGEEYGAAGAGFMRMNIACPKSVVEDGLERLKRGIEK